MRRVTRIAFVAAACVALAGCGRVNYGDPASQTAPAISATCNVADTGYVLVLTNTGDQPVQVIGFSVVFTSGGQETGSDSEPGNGVVSDPDTNGPTAIIGMNDWITAGNSFTYQVQLSSVSLADSCALANWSNQ